MRNFVIINGVNSNTINGLGINELPPITKPEMRTTKEEIDGRDGDITTNLGYSAYDKTITIGLFGTGYDINDIVAFFNGEGTIVFSNEQDKYYNFKILNQIDYESLQKFRTASITFHCQPFKYPLSETPLEIEYDYIEDDGETLTLNNTGNALMKLDLKGNTSQSGTPTPTSPIPVSVVSGDNDAKIFGKNIYDFLNNTYTKEPHLTITKLDNGYTITNSGSGNERILFQNVSVDSAKSYVVSFEINNPSGARTEVGWVGSSKTILSTATSGRLSSAFTGIITSAFSIYVGANATITFTNIMLCEGNDTSTPYEPYQSQTYEVDLPVENMLDNTKTNTTPSVVTTTYISGTRYRIQGLATGNKVFMTGLGIPSDTYTLSITLVSGSYSGGNLVIQDQSNTTIGEVAIGALGTKVTKTITGTVGRLILWNTSTFDGTFDIQLEKGTKSNNYIAYNQTPLELCKIGTYQDYFTKNSGKNLIDNSLFVAGGGTTIDSYDGNSLTGTYYNAYTAINQYINVSTGKYTFSVGNISNSSSRVEVYKYKNGSVVGSANVVNANSSYTVDNTDNSADQIRIALSNGNLNGTNTITFNNLQLEVGDTKTTFEPYGTNQWCKYNAIGKVVLDGSEDGWNNDFGANLYSNAAIAAANPFITGYGLSNYYKYNPVQSGISANTVHGEFALQYGGAYNMFFKNTSISTTNDFKTWLNTHNTTVYFPNKTPYLSLIEDNNLIEQLDNLENAMSYEGTTNIGQVNNDKAFIISAKALEDGTNEVVVNNIGNVYSKPLLALEGSGNVDIYLDNTQILKANVEDKMNIDIAQLEAYNPDTMTLLNRQVIGNYNSMTLQPGNNTIRIDGALDKATISNYTRWL